MCLLDVSVKFEEQCTLLLLRNVIQGRALMSNS